MTTRDPTSDNNKVAACARFTRFEERGTEAAPETSERYQKARSGDASGSKGGASPAPLEWWEGVLGVRQPEQVESR